MPAAAAPLGIPAWALYSGTAPWLMGGAPAKWNKLPWPQPEPRAAESLLYATPHTLGTSTRAWSGFVQGTLRLVPSAAERDAF